MSIYVDLIKRPKPVGARILSDTDTNTVIVTGKWSQRSLERNQNVNFQTMHFVDCLKGSVRHLGTTDITYE